MDKKCSYICDANGVGVSKKVNGCTTEFNVLGSKILAQDSIDGYMYFQYSGDELIGFHLEDAQYFYIKNLNGDIVGIEDYDGNLIAQYEYDEWGKLLNITTAEEGNEEQLRIANANPFRYRGYYYDSETGYYYLQSRYYNPEWGRFISADDLNYLNSTNEFNLNAYMYCWNCPVAFEDSEGTTPQLSINLNDILSFVKTASENIKNGLTAEYNKITKLLNNWSNALKTRYNEFIDKLEFALNYPDAVMNQALSTVSNKLFNKDVNVRFRLIEFLRSRIDFRFNLQDLKVETDNVNSDNSEASTFSAKIFIADDEKTDNWLETALKTLVLAFQLDNLTRIFEQIIQVINPSFNFNNWFDSISELNKNIFTEISLFTNMVFNRIINELTGLIDISTLKKIDEELFIKLAKGIIKLFYEPGPDILDMWLNFSEVGIGYSDGTYYGSQGVCVFVLNAAMFVIGVITGANPTTAGIYMMVANIIMDTKIDFDNGHFGG